MNATADNTCALILSGGRGRRMNFTDKGLIEWRGKKLIEHVIDNIKPQLSDIIISANQNTEHYQQFGYSVISDNNNEFNGPLAGISAAMHHSDSDFLLVVPVDCPVPPADLFSRLSTALNKQQQTNIAVADDGKRQQPLFGLYSRSILTELDNNMKNGNFKVMRFIENLKAINVDFSDQPDAFINFNQPEDMPV